MSNRADQLNQPNHLGKTLVLTATEEHKARADRARDKGGYMPSRCCLVAQVLIEHFPLSDMGVSHESASVGEELWVLDGEGALLTIQYDDGDEITLPHTFSITLINEGQE